MSAIPAFVYWEDVPAYPRPGYIDLCRRTHLRHLSGDFELIQLSRSDVRDLVPELPEAAFDIRPTQIANSIALETRSIALFTGVLRTFLLDRYGGIWLDADAIAIRPFTTVLERLETHEFVGSVNGMGGVTNAFFAVRPGSRILEPMVEEVAARLAQTTTLEWGELGFKMLAKHVAAMPEGSRHVFPLGSAIVVPARERRRFIEPGLASDVIGPETFAAIFFNNGIGAEFRALSPEQLLTANCLVADLFRVALGLATA